MYFQVQTYTDEASLFLHYHILVTLRPHVETLSLHIVIALATCVPLIALYRYCYRKIANGITSLSYRFWNIGTVIAFINYSSGYIGIVIMYEESCGFS